MSVEWVYFIQAGYDGPIKIGTAKNVEARKAELQTGNPRKLHVLGKRAGGRDVERELHDRFRAYRIRGEWFHPAPPVVQAAKRGLGLGDIVERALGEQAKAR
jgi:hypothetical protein